MVFNALNNLVQPDYVPQCLVDLSHEVTRPINDYFIVHTGGKNALIIISSLMVDITVIVTAAVWIIYGKTLRLFFAVATFMIFNIVLKEIFYFRFPDGYIWEYPGFPSLSNPYYPANDFFFCAQIGLCVIFMLNFRAHRMSIMKYFTLVTILLEFFVLIVTRAHYIIDVLTGIVAGHYFFMVGTWLDEVWNRKGLIEGIERKGPEDEPLLYDKKDY